MDSGGATGNDPCPARYWPSSDAFIGNEFVSVVSRQHWSIRLIDVWIVKSSLVRLPTALWCAAALLIVFNDQVESGGGGTHRQIVSLFFISGTHSASQTLGSMCPRELWDHHIKKSSMAKCRRYTSRAVRDGSVWTCGEGGFTACTPLSCCFSDRWKIVPTSKLWTGGNGKDGDGSGPNLPGECSKSLIWKWCAFDAVMLFHLTSSTL